MPALTEAGKAFRDWNRIVDKLADRALRSMPIYLVPREVQVLVAAMDEITTQALLLQKVIEKYPDLWDNLVESLRGDKPGTDEDSEGVRGDDQVDPEDLHNTFTPEPVRTVASSDA